MGSYFVRLVKYGQTLKSKEMNLGGCLEFCEAFITVSLEAIYCCYQCLAPHPMECVVVLPCVVNDLSYSIWVMAYLPFVFLYHFICMKGSSRVFP